MSQSLRTLLTFLQCFISCSLTRADRHIRGRRGRWRNAHSDYSSSPRFYISQRETDWIFLGEMISSHVCGRRKQVFKAKPSGFWGRSLRERCQEIKWKISSMKKCKVGTYLRFTDEAGKPAMQIECCCAFKRTLKCLS